MDLRVIARRYRLAAQRARLQRGALLAEIRTFEDPNVTWLKPPRSRIEALRLAADMEGELATYLETLAARADRKANES